MITTSSSKYVYDYFSSTTRLSFFFFLFLPPTLSFPSPAGPPPPPSLFGGLAQPKKGASDPIATSRPRRHMRTPSSVSGISLQDVAEVMREGESSEGGPGSVVSLSSSCASVNSLRTADLTLLSVDAALDRKEGSLSPSPVSFHRCSSGGSVGAVDDTLEGPQSTPHATCVMDTIPC